MTQPKPTRTSVVGVSLKMYLDRARTRTWLRAVAEVAPEAGGVEMFVLPSYLAIADAAELLAGTGVAYGAQDVFWEDSGAYTGEVSAPMLADAGCSFVEVGHAERRRLFGETDEIAAAKAAAAARSGLTPIVCVGELGDGSALGGPGGQEQVDAAVRECVPQVRSVLAALPAGSPVVFAYEPVWAIGAAEPAPPEHVVAVVNALRAIAENGTPQAGLRFIYGGSAGPGTFAALDGAVDGLFLGRFAHDPANLRRVVAEVRG
ncbi:triosephosphate isomerase [Nakamurella flavida]|uniref:Triosephosphate isomerase n=1 Tax=Nakamurella flavida TaxID=363630 RepID=A0A938YJ18_9ACTN|nr:triose-phosphate isomerase family protein [Nakamurella flavida]MBM9475653.1 triosephosphate isomerase [Nakamurella flavida]MDP9778071.1 triosephosphate isomerase [Nakamurella flavida]